MTNSKAFRLTNVEHERLISPRMLALRAVAHRARTSQAMWAEGVADLVDQGRTLHNDLWFVDTVRRYREAREQYHLAMDLHDLDVYGTFAHRTFEVVCARTSAKEGT